MNLVKSLRPALAATAFAAMVLAAPFASAQDIAESHLQAARETISALNVTDEYDAILPQLAQILQAELIQKDPNMEQIISTTVQDEALKMVARRAALEGEVARAYANAFSEEELKAITAFYQSAPGKKLLSEGPIATREVMKAVEVWQNGLARDLAENVGKVLEAAAKKN